MSSSGNKRLPNSSSSSGSDLEQKEKKRLRRKESNRESARRSRQRKQRRLEDLVREVASLTTENDEYARKIGVLTHGFVAADTQNAVLKAEKQRLVSGLESLQAMAETAALLEVVGEDDGYKSNDGNKDYQMLREHDEIRAGLMMGMKKPWPQLPTGCSTSVPMPLIGSSGFGAGNEVVFRL